MVPDPSRRVEVGADRFAGWVHRFGERHGGPVELRQEAERPVLRGADGATAELDLLVPVPAWPEGPESLDALVAHVEHPHPYLLLLVRRGGWAAATVHGSRVVDSRVGTRYVQGKTKAGGWSQQRYARRRARQADTVVDAAVEAAAGLLSGRPGLACVTGGDRLLVRDALRALQSRLGRLEVADRRVEVRDPRRRVLDDAARSASAVRILVVEPDD